MVEEKDISSNYTYSSVCVCLFSSVQSLLPDGCVYSIDFHVAEIIVYTYFLNDNKENMFEYVFLLDRSML